MSTQTHNNTIHDPVHPEVLKSASTWEMFNKLTLYVTYRVPSTILMSLGAQRSPFNFFHNSPFLQESALCITELLTSMSERYCIKTNRICEIEQEEREWKEERQIYVGGRGRVIVFVAMQEIRARVGKNIYHQTRVEWRHDCWEEVLYYIAQHFHCEICG
jgi:hypothetical protein